MPHSRCRQSAAVGWHAETFKRLWWSGSKAKFYGVTWRGDETKAGPTWNYHVNAINAFRTAGMFKDVLGSLTGETVVAAHSLGNMLVSSAISDHDAAINHYFMLNAAVPKEAYDATEPLTLDMLHRDWGAQGFYGAAYPERVMSSEWYLFFPPGDGRRSLTWRGRLANQRNTTYYNFYSSGEEVLQARPHGDLPDVLDLADLDLRDFTLQVGRYAWALQEKKKGRMATGVVLGSAYGGWDFNRAYDIQTNFLGVGVPVNVHLPPEAANALSDDQLRVRPFFRVSGPLALFTPRQRFEPALFGANGSTHALANRDRSLAEAFPARTLAAGVSPTIAFPAGRNLNLNTDFNSGDGAGFKNGWPAERGLDQSWRHSDFRAVNYLRVFRLYQQMVLAGELN